MQNGSILKQLIDQLGVSVRAFEIAIGVGPTAIDKAIKKGLIYLSNPNR
jgi:hypothetical protein